MTQHENEKNGAFALANPGPLGLMGFGVTTVLLNLHNAGIIAASSLGMIFAMGIFYGGIAQVIAGIMEFRKGNTFGMTAFTSYGMFWIGLVALLQFKGMGWVADNVDAKSMAFFFVVWGIFSLFMFVATLKKNLVLQAVFGTLVILFALLAAADFTGIAAIKTVAGYEGILCGALAIYLACAEIINDSYGKKVLPI